MTKRFLTAALLLSVSVIPAYAAKTSLVVGMPIEPPGLDPTIAAPVAIREVTWVNLYEGLVRIDRNGKVQPLLAKSWEVSPDGLTYTFRLQEGVKFHDGSAFDSADVKFAFDRARDPKSTNAQKQIFAPIDTIETPDPATVVIKLKETSGNFLTYLGWGDAVIVAPESAATNAANPVGTGPFKFKSWTRGDRVELVRNADYWQKDKIKLDSVTFRFISDAQAQVAALKAGDVDAFPNLGAPELFAEFKKDSRFKAVAGNTEGEIVAGMNNAKKPFDDVRVRRALMHAIDRKALVEGAYSGFGQPIGSFFSPNHPAFVDMTGVIPYDVEKAKALLKEAGYGNGLSITIKSPQMAYASRSAELLSAMMAEAGVELKIIPTEFPAKWIEEVFKAKDYDMTIVAHTEPLDIDIFARDNYYFNYKNDKFKAVVAEAAKTTDEKARFAKYAEAQKILAEDVPALFLFQLPKLGVWNAKVQGLWENSPIPSNDVTEVSWSE
ncbi:peptide/nickel transport system substrate-binding protein [Microvirga flocculans]|uniref:Peptide/nickel transport system substrate-binding protein n=1 Tax=Microvirga flocculans TaxID=217168 RepID=A0A7W6IDH2_9HYPH|nr:ABC transporter substrate-binding protein [Microvirga flocculans]MBB4039477.1 peptide/nickel transport system substrate-binding protein [Microvirga flocculans]